MRDRGSDGSTGRGSSTGRRSYGSHKSSTGRGSHGSPESPRSPRPEHPSRFASGRHVGLAIPLFSIPSRRSWGIGEIPDLIALARWLGEAGLDFVQLLPVNEMHDGVNSPYSALSAMAIDPIYISLADVPEYAEDDPERQLSAAERQRLAAARVSPRVDYEAVRAVKHVALEQAFDRFLEREWRTDSPRADAFLEFTHREHWWLHVYAQFRALQDENGGADWRQWRNGRDGPDASRISLDVQKSVLRYKYYQWLADEQWQRVRRESVPVGFFSDFPYMVSTGSADVWARQREFDLHVSVGAPPDAFSSTGQDWGLPAYRWDLISREGFEWLRQRADRCAALGDGFRVDHLVGFYRMFVRLPDGAGAFIPPDEPSQRDQGEQVLGHLMQCRARVIAEDLGTVPDFVRESLAALNVPGMKVLRWEREWDVEGQPFRDPAAFPRVSVATSGTHDTETLAEWWDGASREDRAAVLALPELAGTGIRADTEYSPALRDALLSTLGAAGSDLLVLPVQDVFGWRDRINTPASIGDHNWSWRLPWPVEGLLTEPEAQERARFLRALVERHARVRP
jgi:4-alpha-glucanotransferase